MMRPALIVLIAAALALAACGRRGSPEQPPIAGPVAPVDPTDPEGRQAPDREFPLDPLLQ